jgi:glycine oxidase
LSPDVVVVGGGVVGCAVAWSLARAQLSVRLLERDAVGAHASRVAAGMLTPLAEAHGGEEALPFGLESLAMFPGLAAELRERTGLDPGFTRSGVLRVAASETGAERLQARARRLAEHDVVWLDAAAARSAVPALASGTAGALWSPREGHVESDLLTLAYAAAAEALGVGIECGVPVVGLVREGARVVGVRTPDGICAAGRVVLATGPWAGAEGSALGLPGPLPVSPVRGQIVTLRPGRAIATAIVWGEPAYLVPRRDGRLLVGATEEHVGFDCRTTAGGVSTLLAGAVALAPSLAGAELAGAAAGLRPGTPDGLPLIGSAPGLEGVVLAVGHHRNGVLLSPVTGRLVADLVTGKHLPAAAAAFAPQRFAAPRPSA